MSWVTLTFLKLSCADPSGIYFKFATLRITSRFCSGFTQVTLFGLSLSSLFFDRTPIRVTLATSTSPASMQCRKSFTNLVSYSFRSIASSESHSSTLNIIKFASRLMLSRQSLTVANTASCDCVGGSLIIPSVVIFSTISLTCFSSTLLAIWPSNAATLASNFF